MNQTMAQMSKEYVKQLKRKMKLFKDYPELFQDEEFAQRYVEEGDRFATLAALYERLGKPAGVRPKLRRRAA
jgi:hypothetical protein